MFLLEAGGVNAGDWVELGDATLRGGIKALRISSHLEEHFLLLQLPGELVLQGLKVTDNTALSDDSETHQQQTLSNNYDEGPNEDNCRA